MQRSGFATLRLHYGSAPPWLFSRMVSLGGGVMEVLVDEYGRHAVLSRLADTFFFQSLSNALGFDWNSSGSTTVLCGVLQQVFEKQNLGIKVAGGKGSKSRQTQEDLEKIGDGFSIGEKKVLEIKHASRMTAKVDTAAIQADYQLYHHCMIVSEEGDWTVVQQGMNPEIKAARRYHWLCSDVDGFAEKPGHVIVGDKVHDSVLDLTATESKACRRIVTDLAAEKTDRIRRLFDSITLAEQRTLQDWDRKTGDYRIPKRMDWNAVERAYELQPENFERVLSIEGMGPATVRGLALIAQLVYGEPPSWKDPVKYSFAFGGKDGVPYPVDRKCYDEAISALENAVRQAKLGKKDELDALKRLNITKDRTYRALAVSQSSS
ncbi:MAG: DUF763 domain-containing protein [Candidatus Altiarchaeota archaeon]|nr:DUF763 domain-containing protein [Candidatus Altiarchaeota archaeon]